MRTAMLLAACLVLAGCGAVGKSTAQRSPRCVAQTTGLLTLSEVQSGVALGAGGWEQTGDASSSSLGLWNNGDAAYPGFVGRAQRDFQDSAARAQVFHVAEASLDFGSAEMAQKWLMGQRTMNAPNEIPNMRNGVETNPSTVTIGDETFTYQLPRATAGVFTDIESRVGPYVFGVFTQSTPAYDAVGGVVTLMTRLHSKEQSVCGVT